jgi:hypothetical protein
LACHQALKLRRVGCGWSTGQCHTFEMDVVERLREKYEALSAGMGEATRRRWAAVEARALGRGGATRVAKATGLSLPTIRRGLRELDGGVPLRAARQRVSGAGRPSRAREDPKLLDDLDALVDPVTRGDPNSPGCRSLFAAEFPTVARGRLKHLTRPS